MPISAEAVTDEQTKSFRKERTMKPIDRITGIAVPLDRPDIDTDMLIPQRFLRKPLTVGYRNFLFYTDRFDASGQEKPDFILNRDWLFVALNAIAALTLTPTPLCPFASGSAGLSIAIVSPP